MIGVAKIICNKQKKNSMFIKLDSILVNIIKPAISMYMYISYHSMYVRLERDNNKIMGKSSVSRLFFLSARTNKNTH